jgi:anti-sigma factor RsiW
MLPLFLDGELKARQMRAVALHSTRCTECETELRQLERLQEAVAAHIASEVEEVDLSRVWTGVAPRLKTVRTPWYRHWREAWDGSDRRWRVRLPVLAAAAAAAALALVLWRGSPSGTPPTDTAAVDNSAILDSVQSNVESVALLREPETNTMVLWITDDQPLTVDDFGGPP